MSEVEINTVHFKQPVLFETQGYIQNLPCRVSNDMESQLYVVQTKVYTVVGIVLWYYYGGQ